MKIQDQFATVEQCQKLQKLGITARSLMWWVISEQLLMVAVTELSIDRDYGIPALTDTPIQNVNCVNAYSGAELGVMLNAWLLPKHENWMPRPQEDGWYVLGTYSDQSKYPTEAQARAAMLIYLLENNHITAEEVNQRIHQ